MKNLISGAEFHNFEKVPVFIGKYSSDQMREKDGPDAETNPDQKAGALMGYNFEDANGDLHLIGASALIKKAVSVCKIGDWLKIEFTGKAKNAKGQQVNRFKIDVFESESEALEMVNGSAAE